MISASKWVLHGPAKSKLMSRRSFFFALKENLPMLNRDKLESTKKLIVFV